jgi:hypothetical protein
MQAGDMAPALTKYKGRISKSQEGALSQITKNDLLLLKNLRSKFEYAGASQHEGSIIF